MAVHISGLATLILYYTNSVDGGGTLGRAGINDLDWMGIRVGTIIISPEVGELLGRRSLDDYQSGSRL